MKLLFFPVEEKLDVGLQKQAELLLNHVYQSGRSNTSRAPDVVKFCSQILGFFVALIATASIAQGATSFMTSLWQTAVLQMQEKIDSIRGMFFELSTIRIVKFFKSILIFSFCSNFQDSGLEHFRFIIVFSDVLIEN